MEVKYDSKRKSFILKVIICAFRFNAFPPVSGVFTPLRNVKSKPDGICGFCVKVFTTKQNLMSSAIKMKQFQLCG